VPVAEPIEATVGMLLDHVPLPELDSVLVLPTHTFIVPVIVAGNAFTETAVVV
jgi:hypothetical protein